MLELGSLFSTYGAETTTATILQVEVVESLQPVLRLGPAGQEI
jgi:hypothetical protein